MTHGAARTAALVLERSLLASGLLAVLVAAGTWTAGRTLHARDLRAFDRSLSAAAPAAKRLDHAPPDMSEWDAGRIAGYRRSMQRPVEPLARLDVPGLDISVVVLEGLDDWTLNRGVGHVPGTALPGQAGNVGVAGHRDGFFRGLRHVELGDAMSLTTLEGTQHYRVVDVTIVDPDEVGVLAQGRKDELTLVTCYPFYYVGSAPQRYIVKAERVGPSGPAAPAGSAAGAAAHSAGGAATAGR